MPLARNPTVGDPVPPSGTASTGTGDAAESFVLAVVLPVVRNTVKRRFSSARNIRPEDLEDVCADAVSAIIVRLHRETDGGPPIGDLTNYAATVASNTADRFFAARAPQRARLRNRIRYVLTTDARFTFVESEHGVWLCGLAGMAQSGEAASEETLDSFKTKLLNAKSSVTRLPDLICQILSSAPARFELSDVTTLAAHALGITDRMEVVEDHAESLTDHGVRFAHAAELKDRLTWLWREVSQLPLHQRIALLLNLGSGAANAGEATMCALADLRIATFATLAATLEMTQEALAAIWNRVPLPDNEIAVLLQLERQQVINLRSSARQRLTRRMAVIDQSPTGTNIPPDSGTTGAGR